MIECLNGIDYWSESTGVTAIHSLSVLSLTNHPYHDLREMAIRMIQMKSCLKKIICEYENQSIDVNQNMDIQMNMKSIQKYLNNIGIYIHPIILDNIMKNEDEGIYLLTWSIICIYLNEIGDFTENQKLSDILQNPLNLIYDLLNTIINILLINDLDDDNNNDIVDLSFYLRNKLSWPLDEVHERNLALLLYGNVLKLFPASCRLWFNNMTNKSLINHIEKFTSKHFSQDIIKEEFSKLEVI